MSAGFVRYCKDNIPNLYPMKRSSFLVVLTSALILLASCSKDTEIENNGENSGDQENPNSESPENETPVTGNSARASAKKLYTDYYLASGDTGTEEPWPGNMANCDEGNIPQAVKDKIFMRLMYFRKAAGLLNEVVDNSTKSAKAQKAALMMHANGTLSHDPPNDWSCFSDDGKQGAGNSLLTSTKNAAAIDSYIRDQGSDNYPVGHRRWLLWPRLQEIGVGNTSGYNAIWVLGNAVTRPADTPEFIAWPPQGYAPKQLAYPRWSFSIANANFRDTSISMQVKGDSSVSLEIEELTGIYGDNTIVWRPEINTNTLTEDTTYVINLETVTINGETKDFEYEVVLFDVND